MQGESRYNLIDVLGPFSVVLCNHENSFKLGLPILLVFVKKQRKKSQKYFDLSAGINWNLNHSNLCSTYGAMNFQKWRHFWLIRYKRSTASDTTAVAGPHFLS